MMADETLLVQNFKGPLRSPAQDVLSFYPLLDGPGPSPSVPGIISLVKEVTILELILMHLLMRDSTVT